MLRPVPHECPPQLYPQIFSKIHTVHWHLEWFLLVNVKSEVLLHSWHTGENKIPPRERDKWVAYVSSGMVYTTAPSRSYHHLLIRRENRGSKCKNKATGSPTPRKWQSQDSTAACLIPKPSHHSNVLILFAPDYLLSKGRKPHWAQGCGLVHSAPLYI